MSDYTKAKPIEPGCLAVVLDSPLFPEWNGVIVKVIRFTGDCNGLGDFNDFWKVDIDFERCSCFVRQGDLLRIDDPDIEKEIKSEKELEHV